MSFFFYIIFGQLCPMSRFMFKDIPPPSSQYMIIDDKISESCRGVSGTDLLQLRKTTIKTTFDIGDFEEIDNILNEYYDIYRSNLKLHKDLVNIILEYLYYEYIIEPIINKDIYIDDMFGPFL